MASRLHTLSGRLTRVLTALIAVQLALLLVSAIRGSVSWILTLLGTSWILWIIALACNLLLVRCGPVDLRYRHDPRLVNRPDFVTRVALHVLINWSTLALTIVVAWLVPSDALSKQLAWLALTMSIAVWAGFNIQHRRMNVARNLLITTAIAVTLIGCCAWLLFV